MADAVSKLQLVLGADASQFNAAMKSASTSAKGFQKETESSFSAAHAAGAAMSVGLTAALAGVTALAAGMGASVNAAMGFEKSLSAIKAVSGATGDEMKQISALALQLGKDTSFSASEAAAGIEELIKGGVDIKDVIGGAASAALNLAAAGSVSLADASEIASNAMSMFNLKGSDMAMVSDQIAGAANASSLSVTDFKFSLAASGAVANLAGQSFQDTATAIALMGASGIKGSDAGTSLKTMLMNLIPTTERQADAMHELGLLTADGANKFLDAQGNFRGLGEIAGELNKALAGTSESYKSLQLEAIFGSDAIRAAAIMTKAGAEGFNEMAAAMGKVTADQVAKERLDNLAGSMEQLKGSVETAAITFGLNFLPALKGLTDALTKVVNDAQPFLDTMGKQMTEMPGTLAAAWEGGIPLWRETLQTWAIELVAWVGPQIMPMLNKLQDLRETAFAWVIEQVPGWIETLGQWAVQLVKWVAPMINPALQALGKFLTRVFDWVLAVAPDILKKFIGEWVPAALGWIAVAAGELGKHLPDILGTIAQWILVEGVPRVITLFFKLGVALIQGIMQGAGSMWGALFDFIGRGIADAVEKAKGLFGGGGGPSARLLSGPGGAGFEAGAFEGISVGSGMSAVRGMGTGMSHAARAAILARQQASNAAELQRNQTINSLLHIFGFQHSRLAGRRITAGTGAADMFAMQNEDMLSQASNHPLGEMILRLISLLDGGLTVQMDGSTVGRVVSRGLDQRADVRQRMAGAGGLR